jgi:hypothetical protein
VEGRRSFEAIQNLLIGNLSEIQIVVPHSHEGLWDTQDDQIVNMPADYTKGLVRPHREGSHQPVGLKTAKRFYCSKECRASRDTVIHHEHGAVSELG